MLKNEYPSYYGYTFLLRGLVGIEPTTSPTQKENHTTRPKPH